MQIIKAVLMLFGASLLAFLVLFAFNFNPDAMLAEAVSVHPTGNAITAPGAQVSGNPLNALSLGIALAFGTAGLPHILMRFFTVANAKEARKSVIYASTFIGYFYILTFIIGFGAIAILVRNPQFFEVASDGTFDIINGLIGGTNMVAVHLANAVGGSLLLGFLAAVTFATIVAVVAGLGSVDNGSLVGGIFFLGLALTFGLLSFVKTPEGRLKWALIPAAVLLVMGVVITASAAQLFGYIWPAALIMAGIYLLVRFAIARPQD